MTEFSVIEAKAWHCGQMARILRAEQTRALTNAGIDVHREMRHSFDESCYRRAWLIDGNLAALGGVVGSPLEINAYVWVAVSRLAQRYPLAMIKEFRRQMIYARATHDMLVTSILPEDGQSLRFAVFMGFHAARSGRGQAALSKMSRHDLARFLEDEPDIRIPVGTGYAMAVAYRGEIEA